MTKHLGLTALLLLALTSCGTPDFPEILESKNLPYSATAERDGDAVCRARQANVTPEVIQRLVERTQPLYGPYQAEVFVDEAITYYCPGMR